MKRNYSNTLLVLFVGLILNSCSGLFEPEPSNCYIVSSAGTYNFKAVKGNSDISVGDVAVCEVLWESFGTDVCPDVGDLIKSVSYKDGYIEYETADVFVEGNAVIAAKDAYGTILWTWHIWFTDQPEKQAYNDGLTVMMDRNLGATSADPGDVGALGLLYQWGRKDPFLNSSSISSSNVATSTLVWPQDVHSDQDTGTIDYTVANPTTFITADWNGDWYYAHSYYTDNSRWTTDKEKKSIYDPCPSGWRVADGGPNDTWAASLGMLYFNNLAGLFDIECKGMDFSDVFADYFDVWYPAAGCRDARDGNLCLVGYGGLYWSATPSADHCAQCMIFDKTGCGTTSGSHLRGSARSVRCVQE